MAGCGRGRSFAKDLQAGAPRQEAMGRSMADARARRGGVSQGTGHPPKALASQLS
jgi:hypothetical protein